jgi:glycosyltransferase involved in cell wall biosynthesis
MSSRRFRREWRAGRQRHGVVVLNWRDTWHPEGGGSEMYVAEVATRLARGGVPVTVFTARYPGSSADEVREGVRYRRRGGHLTVYLWALVLLAFGRLGRPAAVLEVQNGMPFLARLATGARVVVLVHHVHREQWPVVGPVLARIGWFLESRAAVRVNRGGRYVAVSDTTRRELVGLGVEAGSVGVAYNGLPAMPDRIPHDRSPHPSLVTLSRLVPHKQIEHAIRLVAHLRDEMPALTLTVVGSGWWEERLRELCIELRLTDRVHFTGHVSDAEKYDHLERAWVHVLPSLKEGWGLAIVEAARVGTPSVAYRSAGGVQESILDGVTGLLADGPADLAACVRTLLTDQQLRRDLGAKARARTDEFSWDATARRIATTLLD